MRVIGTAGHVDHGKSTLVQRMTGIDPDRLAEEKARGLTLDLGFAWLKLDNQETIGIVDVPGHRDFIENMLAGIGGIDAALLVIAADEGVMPQTREHLAILDLLGIEDSIIVLSKVDLVDDPDWLEMVAYDIEETIAHTHLKSSPIIPVSAYTGQGLDMLQQAIQTLLADLPPKPDRQQPRLPIDRIFTVDGFGTIVTGTLSGGTLNVGDVIEIQPHNIQARIRGLQSYKQSIETALQGSRVAVNLANVNKHDIERGAVLAYPDQVRPSQLIDVHFRHLPDVGRALKHNAEVKFFCGASETVAQVRVLSHESLMPGDEGWLQLRLRNALPLTQGDRYILRYPSPAQTIGGGVVVNPQPARRWRRLQSDILADLALRLQGSPEDKLLQLAHKFEPVPIKSLPKELGIPRDDLEQLLTTAIREGKLIAIGNHAIWTRTQFEQFQHEATLLLSDYHQTFPLRAGMLREEVRQKLQVDASVMNVLLTSSDFEQENGLVRLKTHRITFTQQQEAQIKQLNRILADAPFTPPSYQELCEATHRDIIQALLYRGDFVQVQTGIVFSRDAYEMLIKETLMIIDQEGQIDVSRLRDAFGTSRKYAIAVLEHFDQQQITKRIGDVRIRGNKASPEF